MEKSNRGGRRVLAAWPRFVAGKKGSSMIGMLYSFAFLSLMLSGAIFGFFYAWVCSTMWGLDAADPVVAIKAMQAMNASVRNVVFAPAFFGTPFALAIAAALAFAAGRSKAASAFGAAALVYVFGGLLLTMAVNVPMNEALATIDATTDSARAQSIWQAYSKPWQAWNTIRAIASGITLALTGFAIFAMRKQAD